jgi:formate-dependent nitrite reductase membrane component NrfD
MRQADLDSEAKLDALREHAAQTGKADAAGAVPEGAPFAPATAGYYGAPLLKRPVWTWEIPFYFFVGGIAGTAAVIAFVAHLFGGQAHLVRFSLAVALVSGLVCPLLLISDLGRPGRFLNMLRIFKPQSPMSVGAWTLAIFGFGAALSMICEEAARAGFSPAWLDGLGWAGEAIAAAAGLVLLSYTGVLLGATAIPVWSENRKLLPPHFVASALGTTAGIIELFGFFIPATQFLGFIAAAVETVVGIIIEVRKRPSDAPLRSGKTGWTIRAGGVLAGPVSLLVRIFLGATPAGRQLAAACFIAGALISRFAWLRAGRASSKDTRALFAIQRKTT